MKQAFTLVELLIVVTIIVVLLALLTPALDRAIYQAELVVCGARLHTTGAATVEYALANKRSYMGRLLQAQAAQLRSNATNTDFRPALSRAFPVNTLNDPLVKAVDLTSNYPDGKDRTQFTIFASYNIFVSYNCWWDPAPSGTRTLKRMGDSFNYADGKHDYSFRILYSDRDVVMPYGTEAQSSHPDRDGKMYNIHIQDGTSNPWESTQAQVTGWEYTTLSFWRLAGDYQRGPVDDQFLYDDLSVRRYDGVVAGSSADDTDERMVGIPIFRSDSTVVHNQWIHMPRDGGQ
jgi:prepilin-type N-terminal cleavage/methylation domain-containing protein